MLTVKMLFLVILFCYRFSVHVDNKKRNLNFCLRVKWGLDDTTITAEAKYPINFTRSRRRC